LMRYLPDSGWSSHTVSPAALSSVSVWSSTPMRVRAGSSCSTRQHNGFPSAACAHCRVN